MPLGRSMENQKPKIVVRTSCNIVPKQNANIRCGFCPALFNTFFAKTNHWALEHSEKKNGGNYFNAPNQTGVKRGEKLSKILVKNLVKLPNTNSKDGEEQVLNIRELSTNHLQKDYAGMKSKITLPPIRSDKIIAPKVSSTMIKNSEDWESFIQENYKSKSSQIQTKKVKDSNHPGIKSKIAVTPIIGSDKMVAPKLSSTLVKNPFYNPPKPKSPKALMQKKIDNGIKKQLEGLQSKEGHANESKNKGGDSNTGHAQIGNNSAPNSKTIGAKTYHSEEVIVKALMQKKTDSGFKKQLEGLQTKESKNKIGDSNTGQAQICNNSEPPKPKSAKALFQKKIDNGIKKQSEGLQSKEDHAHESKNKGGNSNTGHAQFGNNSAPNSKIIGAKTDDSEEVHVKEGHLTGYFE